MVDINEGIDSPLLLQVSFNKLLNYYEESAKSNNPFLVMKAERVLAAGNSAPELRTGFSDPQLLKTYQKEINIILEDSFSEILTKNEIKTASVPLHNLIFNSSERFKTIIENAGKDFKLTIANQPDDDMYRQACIIILYLYYGYNISLKRSFFYEIPDVFGILRTYKILYNADFIEVHPHEKTSKITEEDYNSLLESYDDMDLWREKFPPKSYIFKGFTINNIFDVTDDRSISEIKSSLLGYGKRKHSTTNFVDNFQGLFESLFKIKSLKVGYVAYNKSEQKFERVGGTNIKSYLLFNKDIEACKTVLCEESYKALITENTYLSIPDVDKYQNLSKGGTEFNSLHSEGIKSAILAPIATNGELLGVLEIVSTKVNELNSVNANLLIDIMPFIVSSVLRSKEEEENLIEAVIQQECTSIHPSVYWRFVRAARVFLDAKMGEHPNATFEEITFDDVYPLFGQIDVVRSSDTRNEATRKDLMLQLKLAKQIIQDLTKEQDLPIYGSLNNQLDKFTKDLRFYFGVDTEKEFVDFFEKEIHPLFTSLNFNKGLFSDAIASYFEKIDKNLNLIYHYRKNYDDTIALINKNMSNILDHKQQAAQLVYPHYFERYKTDGVEHNMYIGKSIAKDHSFNKINLYDLRLWQLQVMCEMENEFYQNQDAYPTAVDVASMILAFHRPLTIQFRMDEKRFDVYGTYNARYEVVKKRVDKALIKGTDERVTVSGKLSIIYSNMEDGEDYLEYITFLQSKNIFHETIEFLELEDLQGVTGLKAIRVPIVYHKIQEAYTYYNFQDFTNQMSS